MSFRLFSILLWIALLAFFGVFYTAQGYYNRSLQIYEPRQEFTNDSPVIRRRGKRYLDFTKGSRVSWRCLVKNNLLNVNTIWGLGYGFRANFPFPDKSSHQRDISKRNVFQTLVDVLNGHGIDGEACILKAYCSAQLDGGDGDLSEGMLFKLLKYIFNLNLEEKHHLPYLRLENCKQILHHHCPLSFNSILPYTDVL